MNAYKELVEMLREMSRFFIRNEADLLSVPDEMITSMNAEACKDAADAIEQLVKERDAAVADCKIILEDGVQCNICKHYFSEDVDACLECENKSNFEWRGVQEDNDEID